MRAGNSGAVGGDPDVELLEAFESVRSLVVGEAMLDVYLRGTVTRLSPEGPFPVVDEPTRQANLGGAANVAANLAALGARVDLVSVVGRDASGAELTRLAGDHGVDVSRLVGDPLRSTLTKTRVVGEGRPMVRVDEGSTGPLAPTIRRQLRSNLVEAAARADVVIVSDYRYGIVDGEVLAWLRTMTDRPTLVVDSKDLGRSRALHPDVVTSNFDEVVGFMGEWRPSGAERVEHVLRHGGQILAATEARLAAVTLDADGVVLILPGGEPVHLPAGGGTTEPCGAGDTFTAALSLAMAAGAGPVEAASLAQRAAAVVVNKPGTALCSLEELAPVPKWCDADTMVELVERHRAAGRSIVFTNGCFDVLHSGHVACLEEAASLGDVLIVALNADASVARLKGPGRPVNTLDDRAAVLAGLSVVDHVVAFDEESPVQLLTRIRPDVYCKGGDYRGRWIPEMELVRTWSGRTHYTTHVADHSTTDTLERIRGEAVIELGVAR